MKTASLYSAITNVFRCPYKKSFQQILFIIKIKKAYAQQSLGPSMSVSFRKGEDSVQLIMGSTSKCALKIGGMTCASCVNNIERTIGKIDGVHSILVSFIMKS